MEGNNQKEDGQPVESVAQYPLEGDEEEQVQFGRIQMAEDVVVQLDAEEEDPLDYCLKGG